MKKTLLVYMLLIAAFALYVFRYEQSGPLNGTWEEKGLRGNIGETYMMITFQSGLEYWKSGLKGFEDAADALGVTVEYRGATRYDAQEQTTVIEQAIARKPAGIAISAMDPHSLIPAINKALDAGIPVVLFDAGAPGSRAYSFLGTDNYKAGVTAADKMAELLGREGEVAVLTVPGQQNHEERTRGFRDTIQRQYPAMKVVEVADGRSDALVSRDESLRLMKTYPKLAGMFVTESTGATGVGEAVLSLKNRHPLKIISFDTNKATLDMIRSGTISATIAQGTWNMGYWSLQYLFHLHHHLTIPAPSSSGDNAPLPVRVDTGISVVTRKNVDDYYAK
ncbi:substrate-binding domain-containing protein [Paenibacillus kribbensis]|uniref:substrate-binding domain-containing protein n=1 Tax=Paenibacillus kribbensis TaxID=172713 RepID=UPI002DB60128|nr:substrate-binding domain-containing protein [Paenibacillus kribbensis]MEC0233030.1 substrate-binding domain-containing protein [Paenibacillus kribbensis]